MSCVDQERGTAHIVTVAHVLSAWEQEAGKGKRETGERAGNGKWETGNREHETGNGITRHTIAKRVPKGVKRPNECPKEKTGCLRDLRRRTGRVPKGVKRPNECPNKKERKRGGLRGL